MKLPSLFGFAIGPVGAAFLGFVTLPLLTWIFPAETIGKMAMLQVTVSLGTLFFSLGMDQAYVREYHENAEPPSLFASSILPGAALLILFSGTVVIFSPERIAFLLYDSPSRSAAYLTLSCVVIAFCSRFLSLILRMEGRGFAFSASQLLAKLLFLLAVCAPLAFPLKRDLHFLLMAQLSAGFLALLLYAWNARTGWVPTQHTKVDYELIKRLLRYGWPLLLSSMAFWGLLTLDRVFLRTLAGYEQLAIYSVAVSVASGAMILTEVFNIIWSPMVYKWLAEGQDLRKIDLTINAFSLVFPVAICAVGGSSWLLGYVLPSDYHQVIYLVVGCVIAPLFYTLSEVSGIGINIARRTGLSLMAAFGALVLNVALCYLLIPRLGAKGAMIAIAVSFWFFLLARTELAVVAWRRLDRGRMYMLSSLALVAAVGYGIAGARWPVGGVLAWWIGMISILCIWRAEIAVVVRAFRAQERSSSSRELANEKARAVL